MNTNNIYLMHRKTNNKHWSYMKIEGGSGGKRGHGNMEHWTGTETIKAVSKKLRRAESKKIIKNEIE